MTEEQIHTMLAVAWLDYELSAAEAGIILTEGARQMWTLGFLAGAQAYGEHVKELIGGISET